ncbi:MAG TPA: hypothetical protein VFS21_13940 [Roseiflexaceae bacterium]|nr:hypothetical protein [Roseiflexaceae bacterium]
MIASGLDDLRPIWNDLKRRNDWALVSPLEETPFLERAAAERIALGGSQSSEASARLAITRVYSVLLHDRLRARSERAALELWRFAYRMARRKGWAEEDAEVIAQETIAQLLTRFHELASPQSLISWVRWLCLAAQKSQRPSRHPETSLPEEDEPAAPLPATADEPAMVEQQVFNQQLLRMLAERLTNPLQRQVVIRWLLFGDKPSDVAHDLDKPLHLTRLAKSRALKVLREDPVFMRFLVELAGEGSSGEEGRQEGAQDDSPE